MYEDNPKRIGELLGLSRKPGGRNTGASQDSKTSKRPKGANSERASLIGRFTDKINETRDGKKYKKLSYKAMAVKLSHLELKDLYYLWSFCQGAKNFPKTFWWSLNPKKHV